MVVGKEGLLIFEVGEEDAGIRIDQYLARVDLGLSRTKAQKLIDGGAVLCNGDTCQASELLAVGDVIEVELSVADKPSTIVPVPMKLEVLYEDEAVVVINKPAGLVVHGGAGDTGPTLVQGLLYHCSGLSQQSRGEDLTSKGRPGIVHRLDKDTTGALVCAKTDQSHQALSAQFAQKTNTREYLALLKGRLPRKEMIMESYLYRDPKVRTRFASMSVEEYLSEKNKKGSDLPGYRYSKTIFQERMVFGSGVTLASIRLFTGRTHQIRIHARELGCPVLGDQVYGQSFQGDKLFSPELNKTMKGLNRQMLHAVSLGFQHPINNSKIYVEAPLPQDFADILRSLKNFSHSSE